MTTGNIKYETNSGIRSCRSLGYNWNFDTTNGGFIRWGANFKRDPMYSPFGPEILDIEISTICHGICNTPCRFCYKSNTGNGINMSFETFKTIFDKIPVNLTQIAFGIGDIDSNLDMFRMFEYCRHNDHNYVIPNLTINGWNLTDAYAKEFARLCGAVAVSRYSPKDVCYDAVKKLTDLGMKQINIHQLISEETMDDCYKLVEDIGVDKRLSKLNAVVFLMYKPKGRGVHGDKRLFNPINSVDKYAKFIDYAMDHGVRVGMDSCSAAMTMASTKKMKNKIDLCSVDPCESLLFSMYINVEGEMFPCSFSEGPEFCEKGIDVVNCGDFMEDVWNTNLVKNWRKVLLSSSDKCNCEFKNQCRSCPVFDLGACKNESL